jgi:MerR family transcriptional regulator, redox-sensitive transcriptional activator SoxR
LQLGARHSNAAFTQKGGIDMPRAFQILVLICFRHAFVQPQPKLRSSYSRRVIAVHANDIISIGDLASRTGVSVSAIRFYEGKGMITPFRSGGGQRRFLRSDIRRISFIRIAQGLGLTIEEVGEHLRALPLGRTPNANDWALISAALRERLDAHINSLIRTRDTLDGCIGCGCLSLKNCALYNRGDKAATKGAGARYLMGDIASDLMDQENGGLARN